MSRLFLNNGALRRAATSLSSSTATAAATATTIQHAKRQQQNLSTKTTSTSSATGVSSNVALNGSRRYSSRASGGGSFPRSSSCVPNIDGGSSAYSSLSSTDACGGRQHRRLSSLSSVKLQSNKMAEPAAGKKSLQVSNINPNIITMEYAVRGPLVIRAAEIEEELKKGVKKPFDEVIRANIGDSHAMGQQPITFVRQLLALTFQPSLLDSPDYPEDVKQRACAILESCSGGSVGSYTDSAGIKLIRQQVADFIGKRDCIPCDWQKIFLTAGATTGIKSLLSLLRCEVDGKRPGVMVPIPQYPLYSATLAEYAIEKIDYYLDEDHNWGLDTKELQRSLDEAKKVCAPRALVVINPGNPTGQVLTRENIVDVIKFAHKNNLFLLADEVYQDNIYDPDSKFYSFRKVMLEMGAPYKDMELVSFMSTSKGYLGECGIRGGYMEIMNMCPDVLAMLTKALTASLCGTTAGQVAVSAYVNPPQEGEPSYHLYMKEKTATLEALKHRAELVYKTLNKTEGFKVNKVQGAMYVFPRIDIPQKAIEAAKAKNMTPDTFYAFELLESAGICIISGSGFGQRPGTYHFRTTILPQTEKLQSMMDKFAKFHAEFMKKYK